MISSDEQVLTDMSVMTLHSDCLTYAFHIAHMIWAISYNSYDMGQIKLKIARLKDHSRHSNWFEQRF